MRDMVSNKTWSFLGARTNSAATAQVTLAADTRGFDAVTIAWIMRVVTEIGGSGLTATLQHSDATSEASFENVPAAQAVGGKVTHTVEVNTNDYTAAVFGYLGIKRYVRLRLVGSTGDNTNAITEAVAVLNKPHRAATTSIVAGTAIT